MTLETIAEALHARQVGPGRYMARCISHEDRNPSLSLTERNGKILVHCFASCAQSEVIGKLKAAGLWPMTPPIAPHVRREYARDRAEREERILELVDLIDSFDHLKLRAKPWSHTWIALCLEQREMRREIEELRNADRQPLMVKKATA